MARTIKRLLITGAQGFVGRHLAAQALSSDSLTVLGIGRSPQSETFTHYVHWGARRVLAPIPSYLRERTGADRYTYVSADIRDRVTMQQVLREFRPDAVVHLASALAGAEQTLLSGTNVEGTTCLLEALRESVPDLSLFVLGSTGGVYGAATNGEPLDESAPCHPFDPYSASKLAAEQSAVALASSFAIPVVRARIFNVSGPGQQEQHVCAKMASQCAAISEQALPSRLVVGNLDTTRDIIDVRDVARALDCVLRHANPGTVLNVSSGREVRIRAILDTLLEVTGLRSSVEVQQSPDRHSPVQRHYGAVDRLRTLGFTSRYSLFETLGDLVDYYQREVATASRLSTPRDN